MSYLVCFICGNQYQTIEGLVHHMNLHPPSSKDRFKCSFEDCFTLFSNCRSFLRHMDKHFKKGIVKFQELFQEYSAIAISKQPQFRPQL